MANGWKCWKIRPAHILLAGTLLVAAGAAAGWWAAQPRTPAELYRARCGACHALPDLSPYGAEARAAIVEAMRRNNGAGRLIDDREAATIIDYLAERAERE